MLFSEKDWFCEKKSVVVRDRLFGERQTGLVRESLFSIHSRLDL